MSLPELDAVHAIDSYGARANIGPVLFREWYRAYPPGLLGAFEQDRPIGTIGLFPVTAEWAEALKRHDVTEHDLRGTTIAQGQQTGADWYLSGISIDPRLAGTLAGGSRCSKLIGECLRRLYARHHATIGERSIRIVSAAATEMGRRLLARYDFELTTPAEESRGLDAIFERRMGGAEFDALLAEDAALPWRISTRRAS
ncbi:MAG TPA: hypothetical protein VKX28_28570 [Xanthobacteraceae bacterium]|nr:hypothetical protein [Xanthobacteraceae bacterium]